MLRIEIKNFQSIAHEVVEVDGFSALVGRSNIGKSAVVRAIKAALTGAPVDAYVRHSLSCPRVVKGAKSCKCFCSVHLVGEGLDLLWEKGDAINQYQHNGRSYTVVNRGTPDFLADGFAMVQVGDEKDILQITDQFKPIFLLNKTGTVVADVLSDVAKLDEINTAMRLVEKDRKDANALRKVREKDVEELHSRLEAYNGLDSVIDRVTAVEKLETRVGETQVKVSKLEDFISVLMATAKRIKSLEAVAKLLIPDATPAVKAGRDYSLLCAFHTGLKSKEAAVTALLGVEAVCLPVIAGFKNTTAKYESLALWVEKVDTLKAFFDRSKKAVSVEVPSLDSLQTMKARYSKLVNLETRLQTLSLDTQAAQLAFDAITKEAEKIRGEFDALGVCHTCNRSWNSEHQHG